MPRGYGHDKIPTIKVLHCRSDMVWGGDWWTKQTHPKTKFHSQIMQPLIREVMG